jgi:hypothetical protein
LNIYLTNNPTVLNGYHIISITDNDSRYTVVPITCSAANHQPVLAPTGQVHSSNPPLNGPPLIVPPTSPFTSEESFLSSSSSDSDEQATYIHELNAYNERKTAYNHQKMSTNVASVKHPITKHCPILTSGDLNPQKLLLLENVFNEFFIAKSVTKEDQVKLILGMFKDMHIRDWIQPTMNICSA